MRSRIFLFVFLFSLVAAAQDFNAKVTINHNKVQTANTQIFPNLEQSISEFLNSKKWSDAQISPEERINLTLVIDISQFDQRENFSATLQILASRPVYGSSYNTVLLNQSDNDFNFTYTNFQPMNFNENSFSTNLTSVLGYYIYIILGLDADSFSPEGGNDYFSKANSTLIAAQSSNIPGWNSTDGKNNKNRFWLIENLTNPRFKAVRAAYYTYHRKGLDIMYKNVETGRNEITKALTEMHKVSQNVPGSMLMKTFFNSKADEIVGLYSQALAADKNKIIEMLKDMDPANSSKWDKIRTG